MKALALIIFSCIVFSASGKAQEKSAEPTAQERLDQTCASIKSGELKDPPAQLLVTCQAVSEEREKKIEQNKENSEFLAGRFCGAPWAPDSPEAARVRQILPKLAGTVHTEYLGQHVRFLTVKSSVINAWTIVGTSSSLVCVPTAIIDFLSGEGELAFIVGHETGHAVDQACKHPKTDMEQKRVCESRADAVGFDLLVKSGFSPFEAAAAFGKLEMYSGDIKTGAGAQLLALGKDHPMTPDRVQHMRDMLTQYNAVLKGPLAH